MKIHCPECGNLLSENSNRTCGLCKKLHSDLQALKRSVANKNDYGVGGARFAARCLKNGLSENFIVDALIQNGFSENRAQRSAAKEFKRREAWKNSKGKRMVRLGGYGLLLSGTIFLALGLWHPSLTRFGIFQLFGGGALLAPSLDIKRT